MIEQIIQNFSQKGNWVDLVFLLLLIFFIITTSGFLGTILDVLGFLFSIIFSYKLYSLFGNILVTKFSLPNGLSNAIGFFIAWFISEIIFFTATSFLSSRYLKKIENHPLNKSLGIVAGLLKSFVIFSFIISLIFVLPVKGQIKEDILHSKIGPFFVSISQNFEKSIKGVFGEAISETLNFITIKPGSEDTVKLGFVLDRNKLTNDPQSESIMFKLLNEERISRGINPLIFDNSLRDVAREYGKEMLVNGFFSHTSQVDGSSPADRAMRKNISFLVIGENLAFTPDVYLAHQGLMNSEGHKKNILFSEYGKAGIGVVDGGVYGKIFVQEFTN